jgi:hypothetical protein
LPRKKKAKPRNKSFTGENSFDITRAYEIYLDHLKLKSSHFKKHS